MNEIMVLGTAYEFPRIKDERFERLQDEIREARERIAAEGKARGLFALARKPALPPEEQLALMESLVANYDELISLLRSRIDQCREVFGRVGEGVQAEFARRLAELEKAEERRLALAARVAGLGRAEADAAMDEGRERVRALAMDLTRASVLIVRKLRHALDALETLASDDDKQRLVHEKLRGDVALYREVYEFNRDLSKLEREIAEMTALALSFDGMLRDNLGPLAFLVDEIGSVDARLGESLAEIERLSAELQQGRSSGLGRDLLSDALLSRLVSARVRGDAVQEIVAALADPKRDRVDVEFEVEVAGTGTGTGPQLDFAALAANMSALVREGLESLGRAGRETSPAAPARSEPPPAAVDAVEEADLAVPRRDRAAAGSSASRVEPSMPEAATEVADPEEGASGGEASGVPDEAGPARAAAEPAAPKSSDSEEKSGEAPSGETAGDASGNGSERSVPAVPAWVPAPPRAESTAGPRVRPAYSAAISRTRPTLVLFLLDRSGSMDNAYSGGRTRAEYLARVVDATIAELSVRCNKPDGVRDYFHLAALGYGDDRVAPAFGGVLTGADWIPISRVAANPYAIERDSGSGPRPRWIEARASGGTPMREAFEHACRLVAAWCDAHPDSYPPTVINVTDGEPTDGSPENAASILRRIHTDDGESLLFNLHVAGEGRRETIFPAEERDVEPSGRQLFRMSSEFPPHLRDGAAASGFVLGEGARFFAYGAGAELATRFLDLGTRPGRMA
ncbi:MAG: hypothetical protein JXA15_12020 [Spirochaetales bacterium]|nr:hypothetical protein [Spirochaetales bacterium]